MSEGRVQPLPAGGRSDVPDERAEQLQRLLEGLVAQRHVHHAIVGVESGDGAFRWIGAAGRADPDGTPMRAETPYFLASITKTFIAAAVLRMHERGRLDVGSPIASYLPHSLLAGLHRPGGVDRTGEITVRHLLAHTSGLADYFEDYPKGGRSLSERLFLEGDRAFGIEEVVRTVREELTPHFPPQPADAPRQRVRYSDTNYLLLIAILEAVTGQGLQETLAELIFRPLGLRHTYLTGHAPPELPAEPATLWFQDQPVELPLAMRSFGDLYGTAEETLRFLRALMRGELFERPATLAMMRARWNRFGLPRDRATLRLPSWPIEYGLGIMRFRLPRLFTPLRAMPGVIGHTGSTGSWLFHSPDRDLYLTGTVNQATGGAVPFRFVPRLLRALDG